MFRSLRRRLPSVGRVPRLIAAALCLLLAASSALHARKAKAGELLVPVVVAAHDLPAGHALHAADLKVARWPANLRPVSARGDPLRLIGQRLAGPVRTGEPISDTRLVGIGLARGLPTGEVAAPVLLDDPHTTDVVHAGDRVTLLETPRPPDAGVTEQPPAAVPVTRVVDRALVLAVLPGSPGDASGAAAEVVLAVDEPTAVRLTRDRPAQIFTLVVHPA